LTKPLRDGLPVPGFERERLENKEIERTLRQIELVHAMPPLYFDRRLARLLSKGKGR